MGRKSKAKRDRGPVEHGFMVRLSTKEGRRPAGRRWFATERPRRRPPALIHFLANIENDPYMDVSTITPTTQPKREAP